MRDHHARLTVSTLAACGVALTGCSAGETASNAAFADTSVENTYIAPAYDSSCVLQIDAPAHLSFTAINNSSTTIETLRRISTEAAHGVSITAATRTFRIEPRTSIAAGQPIRDFAAPSAPDNTLTVDLRGLKDAVYPGASVPVTFHFDHAGPITLDVAVKACPHTVADISPRT